MKTHGCRYHIKTFFHPGFSYTYLGDIVDPQPYYFGSKMPVLAGSLSYYFGSKMPFLQYRSLIILVVKCLFL